MDWKSSAKIVCGLALIALIFGGAYMLGAKKSSQRDERPASSSSVIETKKDTAASVSQDATTDTSEKDTLSASANIDDIAKSIANDAGNDQDALDEEVSNETSAVDAGSKVIKDLGQSYDESEY